MDSLETTIIVIGGSSGGIEALTELVKPLNRDLPAALFSVQHLARDSINYLPKILASHTQLNVRLAEDGLRFEQGSIYLAPADFHLLVDIDRMYLRQGPRENRCRPSIDPLFRSAALSHGSRTIGVVLSGYLDDGTAGLKAIENVGGITVVQDPDDAVRDSMPKSAMDYVEVDHCAPASDLGELLKRIVSVEMRERPSSTGRLSDVSQLRFEVDITRKETGTIGNAVDLGTLVPASCPECGGPLWEMDDDLPRFRCHTGHAYTARHLVAGLQEAEEQSLWVALRVMEERTRMLRRLASKDLELGHQRSYESYSAKAEESEQHVRQIRGLLTSHLTKSSKNHNACDS